MDISYPVTRYLYRPLSMPAARLLARTGVTPVQVTLLSAAFALAGGIAFGFHYFVVGAILMLVGAITDCVDGDLARVTGRSSRRGAFLDSVLDRWTDAAAIIGLWLSNPDRLGAIAAFALVASFLTSYTRARAQSLGVDCPDGIGGRDSRLLVIVAGAIFGFVFVSLAIVVALGFVTSAHRTIVASRALRRIDDGADPGAAAPRSGPRAS